jgi:hypothetical protein
MATLVRTENMFIGMTEVETAKRNGWDKFLNFVAWIMTPSWALDYAEELSMKHNPDIWA